MDTAIAKAQAALREAARTHKRLERWHRHEARRLHQLAEQICAAALAEYGLEYRQAGEGQSDERGEATDVPES